MDKIKPEELRIGNLFNWKPESSVGVGQGIVYVSNLEYFPLMDPIPLTPEWLERAGFTKDGDSFNSPIPNGHGVDICIEVFEDEAPQYNSVLIRKHTVDGVITSYFDYCYMSQIKHVHQLQNLYFALTGNELEFKY